MILGITLLAGVVFGVSDEQQDLEKWILKSQADNQSRFVQGRLRAIAEEMTPLLERKGEISLIWKGRSAYWDYELTERWIEGANWRQGGRRHLKAIELDRELWCFDETSGHFEHVEGNKKLLPLVHELRPDKCWFGAFRSSRQWSDLFDRKLFPEKEYSTTISRQDGKVVVTRSHLPSNSSSELVWSPDAGGNLISYHSRRRESVETHELQWKQHPKGIWYVKELHNERKRPDGDLLFRFKFSANECDPDPVIKDDQFEPKLLRRSDAIPPNFE